MGRKEYDAAVLEVPTEDIRVAAILIRAALELLGDGARETAGTAKDFEKAVRRYHAGRVERGYI